MKKNYYDELIEEIEKLIKEKNSHKALEIIEEELSLPYVPKQYEEKLINYQNILIPEKKVKKQSIFSRDEIITIINEYNKYDLDFILNIANSFEEYNWNGYEKKIEKIFNISNLDPKVKCIIYNNLVLQNLNFDLNFDNLKLNPSTNKTVFETQFAITNFFNLEKKEIKDISIKGICEKLLFIYLMNEFPQSLFYEYQDITSTLIKIANIMIGNTKIDELNDKEKQIYYSINKIQ